MWVELTNAYTKEKMRINLHHVVMREKHPEGGTRLITVLDIDPDSTGYQVIETPDEINQIIKDKIDAYVRQRSASASKTRGF